MNCAAFRDYDDKKRTTWDDLKQEFDSICRDVSTIKEMDVSEEAKTPILAELKRQVNEIKEKMHNYIDTL